MGATSVTGVGPGSAETTSRGPKERGFVGAEKVLGPRVMSAGTVTMAGGSATVILPVMAGAAADYVVMAQDSTAANAVSVTLAINTDDTTLTFAGTDEGVVHYSIMKAGLA